MNADLFVEWSQHFIECIPFHSPVYLSIDSPARHNTLKFCHRHLFCALSVSTYFLQSLDVNVYKPLKEGHRIEMKKFMTENPRGKFDHCGLNRVG
jgi:hypothetical protein